MEKFDEFDIAGAEVCDFLNNIPKSKYNILPIKIKNLFAKYQNLNIGTKIDLNKSYEEQGISKIAKDMIFILMFNYWMTDSEKQNVLKQMKINEEKAKEQYSVEKIFQQRKNDNVESSINTNADNSISSQYVYNTNINKQTQIIVQPKESIFSRIKKFFKNIFRK